MLVSIRLENDALARGAGQDQRGVDVNQSMKPIEFSQHALEQMAERGAAQEEVIAAIRTGETVPAKRGRRGYRRNFQYTT